jgi:cyanate lyase
MFCDDQRIAPSSAPFSDLPPICLTLHEAKARSGLTFASIGSSIGRDEVWVASVFYGQARPSPEELDALSKALSLPEEERESLHGYLGPHWWPQRGLGPVPPTDPVVYRLFEGVLVYGQAIKAIIHEKVRECWCCTSIRYLMAIVSLVMES